MAGVHIIWFSVPVTCKYANVTTLQHFLTIYCQYAHVFCIQQWRVHVVHYKPTDILNLIVSSNVWQPSKWFTFHCYVDISCILTTVRQFSTTTGPHWNISYTLIKTAGVVHYTVCLRKNDTALACYNIHVHQPILIIFGRNVAKKAGSQMMLYFPTLPN